MELVLVEFVNVMMIMLIVTIFVRELVHYHRVRQRIYFLSPSELQSRVRKIGYGQFIINAY